MPLPVVTEGLVGGLIAGAEGNPLGNKGFLGLTVALRNLLLPGTEGGISQSRCVMPGVTVAPFSTLV